MTTIITKDRYVIDNYEAADEDSVLELMEATLGTDSSRQKAASLWRWKHIDNYFGRSLVCLARDDYRQLAGMRAFMRWKFRIGDREVDAVRAVDTATHPEHQRRGIFTKLTLHTLQEAKKQGVDLVFNTPNKYSMPGYLKMGWSHVGILPLSIRVLNPAAFAYGLVRNRLSRNEQESLPTTEFSRSQAEGADVILDKQEDLQELLNASEEWSKDFVGISTFKTVEYLRWRYLEHPHLKYYSVSVGDEGALDGCIIFRTNMRFGLKEIVLSEIVLSNPDFGLFRNLMSRLTSVIKADYLIAYSRPKSFLSRALHRSWFLTLPKLGMHFTANPLTESLQVDPTIRNNWALSLGDLELF